ncbi:MAG TPA: efflux RND transporter permease subunit, partial [Opitutales bacterium]|nr:efflux RND transporter permease subunit [Opitutales bacterium]
MNLSAPFIRRPVGTSLLALGLFLCGIVAYHFLPVAAVPRVDYPMISVSASLPGADPETVASALATPLERRLGQISGITEMTSSSNLGGCNIRIQFDLSRDINSAAQDVQAAINASMAELPSGMPRLPSYRKVNPADMPILILALTSDKVPLSRVFEYADEVLAQKISQIEGVSEASISGAEKAAVRVRVNPGALASAGLGIDDVRTMLAQTNVNLPVGSIDGAEVSHSVVVNGQMSDAAAYNDLVIPRKGGTVELRNFGTAFESVENTRVAGWANGRRAVLVFVNKEADANVIETVDRIKAALPQLSKWMPPGVNLEVLSDRTTTIRASVHDVQFSLLLSISLVVMVVFLFLRRFWPTFIANVTVPLSMAGTMAGMYLCGFSLDNLSLMAITISVGFVVDDAIVVIENIH